MGERGEIIVLYELTAEDITARLNLHLDAGWVMSQEIRADASGGLLHFWCVMSKYPTKEGN